MMAAPIRTCVGCRVACPQLDMVRLVWDGTNVVVSRTATGRGAWIHAREECLVKAQKKGLSRALRVSVPPVDLSLLMGE